MKEKDDVKKFWESLEDTAWVLENYKILKEKYEGKFIAVFKKEVILSNADIDGLMEELEESFSDIIDFVTTEFVGKKEVVVII